MRIKTKITLLVAGVLLASFLACGAFSVNRFMNASVEHLAENESEKLTVSQWALEQSGTREELEQMSEPARDAYLKYQFKRCYRSGYTLIKGDECISNLTDYEIVNPAGLTGGYCVQRVNDRWMLIMEKNLDYPDGFRVLAVRDITSAWEEAWAQVVSFLAMFACIFAAAMVISAFLIRHMLRMLEHLQRQADAISRGDFSLKTKVDTHDEFADLSESINRMSDRIEEQIDDLQLLLGALAHETKTPVTSIMGYADSLLHVRLNETQKETALEAICRSARRLDQMSGKLMQLIGSYENQEMQMEPVPIGDVLLNCCAQIQALPAARDIHLSLEFEPPGGQVQPGSDAQPGGQVQPDPDAQPGGFTVTGDRLLLESLFENLLTNAVKSFDRGGSIRVVCGAGTVRVQDNGCGIPAADLPHVRKAFYMADKSRSRRQQGAGLGLALVQRIVELHHARLEIESTAGVGTQVTVTFP